MAGRRRRWRYTSPAGAQLLVTRLPDGRLEVGIPSRATIRSVWPQLPVLPSDLEPRVREVTLRDLAHGQAIA